MSARLIGLSGRSGAGKDTVADVLVTRHRFVRIAIADALKRVAGLAFGLTDAQLWGSERNFVDARWGQTPRVLYQKLGDALREIHSDALTRGWVDSMKDALERGTAVVVPDIRMPGELEVVRSLGGEVWRVERPGLLAPPGGDHGTETALDRSAAFDRTLVNAGTIEELIACVNSELGAQSAPCPPGDPLHGREPRRCDEAATRQGGRATR